MAKVQGHLLKYDTSIFEAIEHAKELIDDQQDKEMAVSEWLRRLNFEKYTTKCYEVGIRLMTDLRFL